MGFFAEDGGGFAALTEGMLLMIFIYWGWDTILSLNEETKEREKTPGRAAVAATLILLATYLLTTVAAISYAGVGTEGIGLGNEDNAGDVFRAISEPVLGDWSWIVLVAVLVSAVASTQTTILPAARGTLAMGVYRALPTQFAKIHPKFKTPTVSTLFIGGVAIVIYVLLSLLGENAYGDVLLAIGLQIAFYYGITAFACVWYFRKDIAHGGRDLWIKGILPMLGGLILLFAFVKSAIDMWSPDYGYLGGWTVPGDQRGDRQRVPARHRLDRPRPADHVLDRPPQRAEAVLPRRVAAPRHAGSRARVASRGRARPAAIAWLHAAERRAPEEPGDAGYRRQRVCRRRLQERLGPTAAVAQSQGRSRRRRAEGWASSRSTGHARELSGDERQEWLNCALGGVPLPL